MIYEYKILTIVDGGCGTLFLGSAGIPVKKLEALLNKEANDGWVLKFQVVETRRMALFWKREAVHITLERPVS